MILSVTPLDPRSLEVTNIMYQRNFSNLRDTCSAVFFVGNKRSLNSMVISPQVRSGKQNKRKSVKGGRRVVAEGGKGSRFGKMAGLICIGFFFPSDRRF